MTRELRRARRDIMAEKPHAKHIKLVKSRRCKCPETCLKHGIIIPLRERNHSS